MAADGSVIIEIKGDAEEFEKEIRGLKTDLDGAAASFTERLKAGISGAAKLTAAGVAAASAGVAALASSAVESYAAYEQLVGGVETLFKESSDAVMRYASDAYKTAGMSANQYMETVTGFSASLLQSLGGDTEKAAEVANRAIVDMADNANKMGSSIESIQNAYQGFAKQNYTMLDNLKLGYGGTKEEMQRLISDAAAMTEAQERLGVTVDASSTSFANIVNAISVVQEEMGIAGTTAAEASETISGSVAAVQSAWENLKTGIADENQDIGLLVDNLVDSVEIAAENLVPAFQRALSGVGQLVTELGPEVAAAVPGIVTDALPAVLSSGAQLLGGVVTGFTGALAESLPTLVSTAVEMVGQLSTYIRENLPAIIESGLEAAARFAEGLRENVGLMVDAALELMVSLAQGLADALPAVIEYVPQIVSSIANTINDNAPKIIAAAVQIIAALISGLIQAIPTLIQNIPAIIGAIVDTLLAFNWVNLGGSIIKGLGQGIKGMLTFVKDIANQVAQAVKGGISTLPTAMKGIGKNIVEGLWNGIKSMISWIKGKAGEFVGGLVGGIKEMLGIHSPSRVMRDEVGKMIPRGVAKGIQADEDTAISQAERMADRVTKATGQALERSGVADRLKSAVDAETMRFSAGLSVASNANDAARTAANTDAWENAPGWEGIDELLAELRAIRQAIAEGKIISVNGRAIGQIAEEYRRNQMQAQGT